MGYSNSSGRIRSTSRRLVEAVGLRCLCSKPHAAVSAVVVRGPQPWNMAKAIAEILTLDDEQVLTVDSTEPDYSLDLLKALRRKHADATIKQVKKYHDQLGHPSNARLMKALKDTGVTDVELYPGVCLRGVLEEAAPTCTPSRFIADGKGFQRYCGHGHILREGRTQEAQGVGIDGRAHTI